MTTGYGRDAWCLDSTSATRFATGRALVAQAIYRRLTTPRGVLRGSDDALTYGYDVAGLIGSIGTEAALAVFPVSVRAEVLKDDRVQDVTVTTTRTIAPNGDISLTLEMRVLLVNDTEAFPLTLAVTDAGATLVGGLPQ